MAVWKTFETWTYEYFGLDEDVPVSAEFGKFLDLWKSKRGDRFAPAWKDYQFEDFADWWGSLIVVDIQHEPFDCYYRLFGTKIVDLFGFDATGKWATELTGSMYDPSDGMDFNKMMSQNPSISYSHGTIYWQNREYVGCGFLELPLSDDNKTVSNILSVLVYID